MRPHSSHGSVSTLLSEARSRMALPTDLADAPVLGDAVDPEVHGIG